MRNGWVLRRAMFSATFLATPPLTEVICTLERKDGWLHERPVSFVAFYPILMKFSGVL
jgi:hypothetical protein